MRLESRVDPTYASLLITYQLLHGLTKLWMDEYFSDKTYTQTPVFRIQDPFNSMSVKLPLQTYRITIRVYYGFLVGLSIITYYVTNNKHVSVSIFDGPILVNTSFLDDIDGFLHIGAYEVTCLIVVLNGDVPEVNGLEMLYEIYRQALDHVKLSNVDDTFNITVNTRQRNGTIFYYKYLKVEAENSFVKMTFSKIRSLSGTSYNCEYGGLIFSDLWRFRTAVYGPYCSQYGISPLGKDVETFHSGQNNLILLIYSYTFQIDVDILFERSDCEGVTNMCTLLCGAQGRYRHMKNPPINYILIGAQMTKLYCKINIQLIKGCMKMQRLYSDSTAVCIIGIYVRAGAMLTAMKVKNDFRYVYHYPSIFFASKATHQLVNTGYYKC